MRLIAKLALLVVLGCSALLLPATAQAAVADSTTGWVSVSGTSTARVAAWRWYSWYGWWNVPRRGGERVWAQPYSTGWLWTWTAGTGWLAMRSGDLIGSAAATGTVYGEIRSGMCGGAPPPDGVNPCHSIPWPNARVRAERAGALIATATTDALGRYTINLAPGTYRIAIEGTFSDWEGQTSQDGVVVTSGTRTQVNISKMMMAP